MTVHFYQSSAFEKIRNQIEDHLFRSVLELHQDLEAALRSIENFAKVLDQLFNTLEQMYQNPGPSDINTEKSFPVHNGRYRAFF